MTTHVKKSLATSCFALCAACAFTAEPPQGEEGSESAVAQTTQAACNANRDYIEQYEQTQGVNVGWVLDRGRPVVKTSASCSGTLLEDGLVITNDHCSWPTYVTTEYQLDDDLQPRTTREDFYVNERIERVAKVDNDGNGTQESTLDYAIFRVYHNPELRWGASGIEARDPVVGERVVSINHSGWGTNPYGLPFVEDGPTSYRQVSVGTVLSWGDESKLRSGFETEGGSSGSGVIAYPGGRLLGIHRNGLHDENGCPYSLASHMSAILPHSNLFDSDRGGAGLVSQDGTSVQLAKVHTGWSSTWRHIVPGRFNSDSLEQLFFYDGQAGIAQFYKVTSSGGLSKLGSQHNVFANVAQVVAFNLDGTGTDELLFYLPGAGGAGVGGANSGTVYTYRTNGSGSFSLINGTCCWSRNYRVITGGKFLAQTGDQVVMYDAVAGKIDIYGRDSYGNLALIRSNAGFSKEITNIVAGEFGTTSANREIMTYDPTNHTIAFYYFQSDGRTQLIRTRTLESTRVTDGSGFFTQIASGNFASGGADDLLFYHPHGAVDTYSVSNGILTHVKTWTEYANLARAVAGNFLSARRDEVFFYDRYRSCFETDADSCYDLR
jgi:V8-like Glu-specific endopeptidase